MIRDLKGTTPATYWASNPNGISQVGCGYTAQDSSSTTSTSLGPRPAMVPRYERLDR
jgi:hypothetical protein